MKNKLLTLLFLLAINCFPQSITEKELIGNWRVTNLEVTQIFCNLSKYNLKDSINKYYKNASFNFLKNGKIIITSHENLENPLHGFHKLNWKLEKKEWVLFHKNTTELWFDIRKVNNKYFFDFFNFMTLEMEKE